jgi:hypothetical protein
MAECSCSQDGSECDIAALQQCFERLYSSPPPVTATTTQHQSQSGSHRSPLPYSLFPLQVGECARVSEAPTAQAPTPGRRPPALGLERPGLAITYRSTRIKCPLRSRGGGPRPRLPTCSAARLPSRRRDAGRCPGTAVT